MAEKNNIDEQFRAQADRLEPIAVSWREVEEQRQRQRRTHLLALIAATLGATLLLTILILTVRTLLDPTFEPPLISTANASGKVVEPKMGRGVVSEGEFLGSGGGTAVASSATEENKGYPLAATVRISDLQGQTLVPKWRLRAVGESGRTRTVIAALGRAAAAAAVVGAAEVVPDSRNETRRLRAWVPAPARAGRYVAEMVLVAKGQGPVERFKSRPFEVVGDECCAPYVTPSYAAELPRGWRVISDYKPAPGGRFVSEAVGPGGMTVIIDTTPHSSGDAMASERYLEGLLRDNRRDYRRIALRQRSDRGGQVVEWSYRVEGKADTEELFYRGGGGFAIRGVSPEAHLRETREFCRTVEKALRTKLEKPPGA